MRLLDARHIHIVGAGGAGMSPLAIIMLALGKRVTGSDLRLSPVTEDLVARGATIYQGHKPENVVGADLVVITSAARDDNPEIQAARIAGIPVVKGSQLLGALMDEREGIAVAGTHGKTTTTAMIATILERAGLDPTFVVGGVVRDLGVSGKLGRGRYMVAEADEYDERFLQLRPRIAVVTSVEAEHLDFYENTANLMYAFSRFVANILPGGWLIACGDDPGARQLGEARSLNTLGHLREVSGLRGNAFLYGLGEGVDYRATDLALNKDGGYTFAIWERREQLGRISLAIPGVHNVRNALAAVVVTRLLSIPLDVVATTLAQFQGAGRRFEIRGDVNGVTVVDDYAHHPTKIRATLAAARVRFPGRRIVALHQPHTYSRLKTLMDEYAAAFADADVVLISDIYPARESDTLGMHSRLLVQAMQHPQVEYVGGLSDATARLRQILQPGDVLLVMGAGDVNRVCDELLAPAAEVDK